MLTNKDRNNKGHVKSIDRERAQRDAEPSSRELKRKTEVKKVKRLKIKRAAD